MLFFCVYRFTLHAAFRVLMLRVSLTLHAMTCILIRLRALRPFRDVEFVTSLLLKNQESRSSVTQQEGEVFTTVPLLPPGQPVSIAMKDRCPALLGREQQRAPDAQGIYSRSSRWRDEGWRLVVDQMEGEQRS